MQRRILIAPAFLAVAIIVLGVGAATALGGHPARAGRSVRSNHGVASLEVLGLDNRGRVIGTLVTKRGVHHGFLWRKGTLKLLGTEAAAINDRGQILGYTKFSRAGVPHHPVLWKNGKARQLDLLPSMLNARGQVLGYHRGHMALWANGAITLLPLTAPIAFNNQGQVVGRSSSGDLAERQNGTLTDVGPGGYPLDINDRGEILFSRAGDVIVWQNGVATDIGSGYPVAINDRGDVIWEQPGSPGSGSHAFLWRDGKTIDLGGGTPGVGVSLAAISTSGQVVGYHLDEANGVGYWFIWQNGNVTRLPAPIGDTIFLGASAINDQNQIVANVCTADCIPGRGKEFGLLWTLRGDKVETQLITGKM